MKTQIDLYRVQQRWELAKVVATFIAAVALSCGAILGISNWISHQPMNVTATVRIEQPLVIHQQ